jgi:hypothetical protein
LFATLFGFKKYNAVNPRFDDTTCQRRAEYVDAIKE